MQRFSWTVLFFLNAIKSVVRRLNALGSERQPVFGSRGWLTKMHKQPLAVCVEDLLMFLSYLNPSNRPRTCTSWMKRCSVLWRTAGWRPFTTACFPTIESWNGDRDKGFRLKDLKRVLQRKESSHVTDFPFWSPQKHHT